MKKEKKELNYGQMIEDIIADFDRAYDRVGGLRDHAETRHKEIFNDARGVLGAMASRWRTFLNSLPETCKGEAVGNWKD